MIFNVHQELLIKHCNCTAGLSVSGIDFIYFKLGVLQSALDADKWNLEHVNRWVKHILNVNIQILDSRYGLDSQQNLFSWRGFLHVNATQKHSRVESMYPCWNTVKKTCFIISATVLLLLELSMGIPIESPMHNKPDDCRTLLNLYFFLVAMHLHEWINKHKQNIFTAE